MTNHRDFDWVFDRDYCGRILQGDFSNELKKRIAESIQLFSSFNVDANPTMPYISAWREDADKAIWYEFVGSRLLQLLGCTSCEIAEIFKDSIMKRCTFDYGAGSEKIKKTILSRDELSAAREHLRNDGRDKGTIDAIYEINVNNNSTIWLKDQATVQSFSDDRICISLGFLIDVTKEMAAEEQRQMEEENLRSLHVELENKLEKQSKELWKTQLEMIYRLAQAAGFKDNPTGLHITKMSHYCDILSEAAGLNREERELLYHATAMHDVGKIGISETILQKPGRLTDKEFEIMKTHSIIGAKLLSGNDSPLLEMAKKIALTHHERWDGKGYPHGLCASEIPLSGRIAAICDVFDALTSERPYKHAWDIDDALSAVKTGRGTQFDPELVDLFLSRKDSLCHIQHRFQTGLC